MNDLTLLAQRAIRVVGGGLVLRQKRQLSGQDANGDIARHVGAIGRQLQLPTLRCVAEFADHFFGAALSFDLFAPDRKSPFNLGVNLSPVALQINAFHTELVVDHYDALGSCSRPAAQQIAGAAIEFRYGFSYLFFGRPVPGGYNYDAGRKRRRVVQGRSCAS